MTYCTWRYYSALSDIIRINFFPQTVFSVSASRRRRALFVVETDYWNVIYRNLMPPEGGAATGRINQVFPWFSPVYSRYRTPQCGPPTANIDSSPQCGLHSVVASTQAWRQLSACIFRFTPDTPTSNRFTFGIYHRFTFCTTCLYQKEERLLNGELEGLDGSVSTVPGYRLG